MNRDELCSIGTIFVEDEKYVLSRYEEKDRDLYFKAWNESFENLLVQNDENLSGE